MILPLAALFFLHRGDTVVFYGDSITEQQLYTTFVEDYVCTRYPNLHLKFYERGWGGDRATGGGGGPASERVERDVKPLHPSVVTIMLGMNDGGYRPFDPAVNQTFLTSYGELLNMLHAAAAPGARFTLIQTSPHDDYTRPVTPKDWVGYNAVLLQYGQVVKDYASKENDLFVDFNAPVSDMLKRAAGEDPVLAAKIIPDSVHPGPAGHMIMAGALLEGWGASPTVSDVELSASDKKVSRTDNASVSGFDGSSWTELDNSLPFALSTQDGTLKLVLDSSDFDQKLNQENLKVTGLDAGDYQLSIDGKAVGKFSSDDLASGINLAEMDTPMREQSLQVLGLVAKKSSMDFTRWRGIGVPYHTYPSWKGADQGLERIEQDLRNEIWQTAKPVPHRFSLTKAS